MAKQETVSLVDIFAQYTNDKKIDKGTLMSVLEESFRSVISKMVGTDENYDVIINTDKGDLEIYRNREIVPDGKVEDDARQIQLSEALKIEGNDDAKVGETCTETVDFSSF